MGKVLPDVELKIGPNNEIMGRGNNIMKGYHNNQGATDEVLDSEGWLHTGDQGEIDSDGFLTITGRIKEMYKSSTGKYVCPVPIENTLCASSDLVDQALVIADGKKFTSVILWPDWENLEVIKQKRNKASMSDVDFLKEPSVLKEVEALIKRINNNLNHWEQLQKFVLMTDKLSIQNGDMTPKMNLRRTHLTHKYEEQINEMYG